jgi:hypothetical protein
VKRLRAIVTVSTVLTGVVLLSQNCARANFSSASTDQRSSQGIPTSVCNPFGGGQSGDQPGLVAQNIYYVDTASLANGVSPETAIGNSVEGFFDPGNPYVKQAKTNVFLSWINFPATFFSQGFTDSNGVTLKTASGNRLDEYFALRLKSVFVAGSWAPGDYQIATLTDDGSSLSFAPEDGSSALVVDNDSEHSMRLSCSTGYLHVDADSHFDLTFDYFQGPRITIGLMLLYRPVSVSGGAMDPLCGTGGSSDSYFFLDHDTQNQPIAPSIPQAPYQQLSGAFDPSTGSGGWKVIEAEHFTLPGNVQSPTCL